jgi:hypothetical protein
VTPAAGSPFACAGDGGPLSWGPCQSARPGHPDFDSPWKEALEFFLAPCLALFFPAVHAGIDWARGYESLDKELHQVVRAARSRKGLADKLFKVWRQSGEEAWLLIHIEVQGAPEEDFGLRMFRYNTRAFDRYNRTVVSLAILTDERPDWRPDGFGYGDWGASTNIRFLTAKLLDWRGREAELEASTNPFSQVVLAHLRALETRQDPDGRRRYKIQLVKGLYQRGWSAEDVRQLFRVIDWLLDLPAELRQSSQAEVHAWEEENRMPYITSIERSGIAKGLKEGIATALALKFGAAGKRLMPRVHPMHDVEELRALLKAIPGAASLQAIRDRLPPRSTEPGGSA